MQLLSDPVAAPKSAAPTSFRVSLAVLLSISATLRTLGLVLKNLDPNPVGWDDRAAQACTAIAAAVESLGGNPTESRVNQVVDAIIAALQAFRRSATEYDG